MNHMGKRKHKIYKQTENAIRDGLEFLEKKTYKINKLPAAMQNLANPTFKANNFGTQTTNCFHRYKVPATPAARLQPSALFVGNCGSEKDRFTEIHLS